MTHDPFAAIRCEKCGQVHWPQLPCLDSWGVPKREEDLRETGLVGALEARGEDAE